METEANRNTQTKEVKLGENGMQQNLQNPDFNNQKEEEREQMKARSDKNRDRAIA